MSQEDQRYLEMTKVLKMVAPGTTLYEGLENILRARTGALIVVSDAESIMKLVDGGFRINSELQPSTLYELAKMDGAIVLSSDGRRIIVANAHLTPDYLIPTSETGTRHRTAERMATQTGELVIAISQRRNVITLYKGNQRYVIRDIGTTLAKANQALQTLQKYKSVLEQSLLNLSALEFENLVTLSDVCTVIQRAEMVGRIAHEIQRYIFELGSEGRLVSMQLDELMIDIEDEGQLVVRDYFRGEANLSDFQKELTSWDDDDLLDLNSLSRALGYPGGTSLDLSLTTRGYRILGKIPRLPFPVVENLVKTFGVLPKVLEASTEELDDVEGIGEVRARTIKDGLRRLREQILLDRHF
ncbi:diadenylate cyclase [Hydrogenispora ethanolica]|uniref:Diadenylate cyclase n=1 Tax=Hydrogenispora ethanolica TaxID=1082276 RepID=A0A4V2QF76_HYDET|nr:DNA integrity scanning diadenylate cyclase DisA [Hydrogenispora ethanolica]TCL70827.1 diadenylate cyclase [Hydrogenispora ethanolica]